MTREETPVAELDDIFQKELGEYDSVFVSVPGVGYYTIGMSRSNRPDIIILTADDLENEITNALQTDALAAWEAGERMPLNRVVTSGYVTIDDAPMRMRMRSVSEAGFSTMPHRGVPKQRNYIIIGLPDENNRVPGEFGFMASSMRPDIDATKHLDCFDVGIDWEKYYGEDA